MLQNLVGFVVVILVEIDGQIVVLDDLLEQHRPVDFLDGVLGSLLK